jgi:hypothetical protein
VFFSTKLKSCSSLESKVQKDLEREIDSRKFLYSKDEESLFAATTFVIYLLIVLLKKSVSVNVLLLTG